MIVNTATEAIALSSSLQLVPILKEQQEEIYSLMRRVYPAAYARFWKDGGDKYIKQLYQSDNLQQEMDDPSSLFYTIQYEGKIVGILRLLQHHSTTGTYGEQSTKLQRIYVAPEMQGKGIGKQLIQWCMDQFLQLPGDQIWLEAMCAQTSAVGFYQKMGFEVVDTVEFSEELVYPHLRSMYIMQKTYDSE
jgi:ribosomal protein S18 acetylase RimI-like enzyme